MSAARQATAVGATVILNAAPSEPLTGVSPPRVDFLVVNEREFWVLTGGSAVSGRGAADSAKLLNHIAETVVVTMGSKGAVLEANGRTVRIDAQPVQAVDATGAGDAFVGGLAFGLAFGSSPLDAVRLASAAGAVAVTHLGARKSLPSAARLREQFGLGPGLASTAE